MEFILELLLEILFEGLFSGLIDWIGRGVARVIRVRAVRVALLMLLVAAAGIGGGYFWGRYAAEQLDGGTPRTLWVSLATAVVALVAAAGLYRQKDPRFAATPGREPLLVVESARHRRRPQSRDGGRHRVGRQFAVTPGS